MAISLYDLTVPSYLQTLGGMANVLGKGRAYCEAAKIDPNEFVSARLHPNMKPLSFQVWVARHHSLGAIDGCKAGTSTVPPPLPNFDYAGLETLVAETCEALTKIAPADVNALEGRDMQFVFGEFRLPFTVEGFLLSFSLPNFYFHATTAYDILRASGVSVGKQDFMGPMRLKAG
jgi:hypothetical protein